MYWNPTVGSGSVSATTLRLFNQQGREQGQFGYPTSDRVKAADGTSYYTSFSKVTNGQVVHRGRIYHNAVIGTFGVWGPIFEHFVASGAEAGILGYPSSLIVPCTGAPGKKASFTTVSGSARGATSWIYSNAQLGTWSVSGAILDKWVSLGAEGGALGLPTSDKQQTTDGLAKFNTFATLVDKKVATRSAIYLRGGVATAVVGAFFSRWDRTGGASGPLGYPTADVASAVAGSTSYTVQTFDTGAIYGSSLFGAAAISGALYTKYLAAGGPGGSLGLPTSSEVTSGGVTSATFQGGTLSAP